MKKLLLSAVAVFVFGFFALSQSFEMYHEGVLLPDGGTVTISGDANAAELVVEVSVKNISSAPKNVKVRKFEYDVLPNTSNLFCWGLCFPPNIYVSPSPILINPGEVNSEFSGHYQPNGVWGVSTMRYTFFDNNNPNDSVCFYTEFNAGTVGTGKDIKADKLTVSNPYPNPASQQTSFNYTLPDGTGSASIKIHNLLGSLVRETELIPGTNKVTLNVSDLKDGIYFYSVMVDNEVFQTKRLVITR